MHGCASRIFAVRSLVQTGPTAPLDEALRASRAGRRSCAAQAPRRAGSRGAELRLSPAPCSAAPRRKPCERQAGAPALARGRLEFTAQAPQASAPGRGFINGADEEERALVDGLRLRRGGRQTLVPSVRLGRRLYPGMPGDRGRHVAHRRTRAARARPRCGRARLSSSSALRKRAISEVKRTR